MKDAAQRGGEAGPGRAHCRDVPQRARPSGKARAAEDEQQVEQEIGDVGEHGGDEQRPHDRRGLQVGAQPDEEQQREQSGQPRPEELLGPASDFRLDSGQVDESRREGQRHRQDRGDDHRQPGSLPDQHARARPILRAEGLGDERIEAHHGADADHRDGEEDAVGKPHRAEGGGTQPPHHRGVHHAHESDACLRARDRHGEPQQLAQLAEKARGFGLSLDGSEHGPARISQHARRSNRPRSRQIGSGFASGIRRGDPKEAA